MFIYAKDYGLTGECPRKDTRAIQRALNAGRYVPTTVFIPKGTYYITRALVIHAHTTLILDDDTVLIRKSNDTLLKNGYRFKKYYGYEGKGHITIYGGTFDMNGQHINDSNTALCLGHAKHLNVVNVTFKNIVGGHAIDACGVFDLFVSGCRFLGFRDDTGTRFFSEAIQLDIQVPGAFPKFGAADGTITQHVWITDCYFGNSEAPHMKPWNRAIGGHASRYNQFYTSIYILNNTFEGMQDYAVTPLKASKLYIAHNVFRDCAGGIRLLAATDDQGYSLDGFQRGTQAGRHLYMYKNDFEGTMEKDVIHIRSYDGVYHEDVGILYNHIHTKTEAHMHLQDISNLFIDCEMWDEIHKKHRHIRGLNLL